MRGANALTWRGAHGRRGRDDRPHPCARWRSGQSARFEVKPDSPNVVPGEVFFTVDLRHPEIAGARRHGEAVDRRLTDQACAAARRRRRAHQNLGPTAGRASIPTASRACARRRKGLGLLDPRYRVGRRPRRRLRVAGRADHHDLRAVPRTASATTRSSFRAGSSVRPARRCCCKRCSTMTAGWRSEPRPPADLTRTAAPANRTLPQWPRSPGS